MGAHPTQLGDQGDGPDDDRKRDEHPAHRYRRHAESRGPQPAVGETEQAEWDAEEAERDCSWRRVVHERHLERRAALDKGAMFEPLFGEHG